MPIRCTSTLIKFHSLPPCSLLFFMALLIATGIFKTKCLNQGQAATCNNLFEQKLRQILLVLFYFPISASISFPLLSFKPFPSLQIKPYSFSLPILLFAYLLQLPLSPSLHILLCLLSSPPHFYCPLSHLFIFFLHIFWSTAQSLQQALRECYYEYICKKTQM